MGFDGVVLIPNGGQTESRVQGQAPEVLIPNGGQTESKVQGQAPEVFAEERPKGQAIANGNGGVGFDGVALIPNGGQTESKVQGQAREVSKWGPDGVQSSGTGS